MAIHSGRGRRNQPDIILFTETQRAYSIGRELGTLLFSAKETIHKAAYPSSRRWIGFEEVSVQSISRTHHSVFGRSGRTAIWPCLRRARDRFRSKTKLFSRCSGFRQCVLTSRGSCRGVRSIRKEPPVIDCSLSNIGRSSGAIWAPPRAARVCSTCSLEQSLISKKWVRSSEKIMHHR